MPIEHEPPDGLNEEAKAIWRVVVVELCKKGPVSPATYYPLERYCYLTERVRELEKEVRGREIVSGIKGDMPNPKIKVLTQYNTLLLAISKQLSLTGWKVSEKKTTRLQAGLAEFAKDGMGQN